MSEYQYRITVPVQITNAHVTDSTVAEPSAGETMFNLSSEYVAKDAVIDPVSSLEYTSKTGARKIVTISHATPAVLAWVAHGFVDGQSVKLSNSGGTLPTGLTAGTTYYTVVSGPDTFGLSATPGGAQIATSSAGSGTHTAIASPNVGNPLPISPIEENDYWIESGVSNRMAVFDMSRDTKAISASPQEYEFAPNVRGNALAIFGAVADLCEVECTSSGQVVYSKSQAMRRRLSYKWSEFFYEKFEQIPSFVMFDIPPFTNLQVKVTLTRAAGDVECGCIFFGNSYAIGKGRLGARSSFARSSKITIDEYGRTRFKRRRLVPVLRQDVTVPNELIPRVKDLRSRLDVLPALFTSLEDATDHRAELLTMLAFFEDWDIQLDEQKRATVSFSLREF